MKYWLHQMESAGGDLENHGIAALEIHRTVAETSGNALLRSVTGIVELTVALALKQCVAQGPGDYLAATLEALTRLVAAIGNADASDATAIVGEVIDLDEARVMASL
jgi:DNA-binding FadR family transcriptional regulator